MKIELGDKPSLNEVIQALKAKTQNENELVLIDQLGEVFTDADEIESALNSIKLDKVDAHWMRHEALETHLAALKTRAKKVAKLIEAHENYLLHVMQSSDEKKLEGDLHWIRRNVKSKTQIEDESKIPHQYKIKTMTLTISACMADAHEMEMTKFLLNGLMAKLEENHISHTQEESLYIPLSILKQDIKSGQEIPGAKLVDSISWSQNPRKQIE